MRRVLDARIRYYYYYGSRYCKMGMAMEVEYMQVKLRKRQLTVVRLLGGGGGEKVCVLSICALSRLEPRVVSLLVPSIGYPPPSVFRCRSMQRSPSALKRKRTEEKRLLAAKDENLSRLTMHTKNRSTSSSSSSSS